MMRIAARCSGDAWRRRGNHARGTDRVRPSTRRRMSSSSVTFTSVARAAVSTATELIPSLHDLLVSRFDDTLDLPQFMSGEPIGLRQPERRQPELGHHAITLDMDVCRLLAIVAGEKQPVRTDDREVRHRAIL